MEELYCPHCEQPIEFEEGECPHCGEHLDSWKDKDEDEDE